MNSTILSAARAVVLDLHGVAARRRVVERLDGRLGAGLTDAVHAEVGDGDCPLGLGAGAHDPLQRRIPGLVDRVGDGEHGRGRRLDRVVAELRLALAAHLPLGDLELGDLRDHGQPEPVGDGGPEHGAVRVARLLAEDDQVGALLLQRRGQSVGRRDEVGALRGLVADQQRLVRAHGERLANRVLRGGRAHGHDQDLAAACLLDPERLLDGVDVEGIDRALARPVEPFRPRIDLPCLLRHVLDTDGDLHGPRLY